MNRYASILVLLLTGCAIGSVQAADRDAYEADALPFFKAHCLRCHDDKQQKGEFRLDTLARDFGMQQTAELWA